MRILVLGGTRFLGRHLVEAAAARGHALTLFNRGLTNPALHAGIERITGDRDGGLDALGERTWDAVVDPSGFFPRIVGASARALAGRAGRYLFVSTISVYAEPVARGADESAPVARLADPGVETLDGGTYGALKAACEETVREAFGERALIVRPGLIVGPHDTSDRFPYWPRRLARGGTVLAPGEPTAPVQLIDVRDLADWMLSLVERGVGGTFHATGPAEPLTLGRCLERVAAAVGASPRLRWASEAFLREQGVEPWVQLPLWLPAAESGFATLDIARALAAGLRLRPLEDTARDTLAWERSLVADTRPASPALTAEREAELLAGWETTSPLARS
ncbi:MAG TPA: SDR family oxidoreductase [Candidatus Eisenbacteria bacterium]